MTAMRTLADAHDPEAIKSVLDKIHVLRRKVRPFSSQVTSDQPLASILAKYGHAVGNWRAGLVGRWAATNRIAARPQALFESGRQLRAEATGEFDRRYAHP